MQLLNRGRLKGISHLMLSAFSVTSHVGTDVSSPLDVIRPGITVLDDPTI
jgi:hypothetical protein